MPDIDAGINNIERNMNGNFSNIYNPAIDNISIVNSSVLPTFNESTINLPTVNNLNISNSALIVDANQSNVTTITTNATMMNLNDTTRISN
jgi:hypothetical protein